MSRYCCISALPSSKKVITEEYKDLKNVVSVIFGTGDNSEEICIVVADDVNDDTKESIEKINRKIGYTSGFTKPIFTPKWTLITDNVGPFITEEHYVQKINVVSNERSGLRIPINGTIELAILSYLNRAKGEINERFENNFRESFRLLTGQNVKELDLSPFSSVSLTLPTPDVSKYGFVTIDGKPIALTNFATPVTSVIYNGPDEGKIKRGITSKDVLVNSSNRIAGLSTKFFPGSCWAFRWRNNSCLEKYIYCLEKYTYSFFVFDHYSDIVEERDDDESISNESGDSQFREEDLMDDDDDDKIREGDDGGDEDGGGDDDGGEYVPKTSIENDITIKRNFESLTDKERYLPLSYIISIAEQWEIIYGALFTNFRLTNNLPKVSDEALSFAADSVAYAIEKGNKVPNSCYSLLDYAFKRRV